MPNPAPAPEASAEIAGVGETPFKVVAKDKNSAWLSETTSNNSLGDVRRKLILDIAKGGLKSSASLEQSNQDSYRSIDSKPSEYVYGRGFKPEGGFRSRELFENSIKQALYMTDNSILSVTAERQGESSGDTFLYRARKNQKQVIEGRLASSMLVVYEGSSGDSYLTRKEEDLGADRIICILLPKSMADNFQQTELEEMGVDIRVVDRKVKRRLFHGDKLKIPDYEGEIKRLLEEQNKPLWIHGVRLPTQEDLKGESVVASEVVRPPDKPIVPEIKTVVAEAVADYGKAEELIEQTAETAGTPIDVPEAEGIIARIRREHKEKTTQKELQQRFDDLTGWAEQVPFFPGVGVVAHANDERLSGPLKKPLHTGLTPSERAIDCNVVMIWGENSTAMLHISPLTLPEEYWGADSVNVKIPGEKSRHVDEKLSAMIAKVGEPQAIQIISGDLTLQSEIAGYLTGGDNMWRADGKRNPNPVKPELIQPCSLGDRNPKGVVSDPERKSVLVKDYSKGSIKEILAKGLG